MKKITLLAPLMTVAFLVSCGGGGSKDKEVVEDKWWENVSSFTLNDVGTIKTIKINGLDHRVRLVDVDHDVEPVNFGPIHTTWEFVDVLTKQDGTPYKHKYADDNTNFRLSDNSCILKYLVDEILPVFPESLKSKMFDSYKMISIKSGVNYNLMSSTCKLFPLTYSEIFNNATSPNAKPYSYSEGSGKGSLSTVQYDYYVKNTNVDLKKCAVGSTDPVDYWLSSPDNGHGYEMLGAIKIDNAGIPNVEMCSTACAIAPAFFL